MDPQEDDSYFSLQPAGIPPLRPIKTTHFETLPDAFEAVFEPSGDLWFVDWSGIPALGRYGPNLYTFLQQSMPAIHQIITQETGTTKISTSLLSLAFHWEITWKNGEVFIDSHWQDLGQKLYASALNSISQAHSSRIEFLQEWQKLIQQVVQMIETNRIVFTTPDAEQEFKNWQKTLQLLHALPPTSGY